MDADGDFVIAWQSTGQDGSGSRHLRPARTTPRACRRASEFQVNTYTTGNQRQPTVAMDADGDFVIAWAAAPGISSGYGIYAQRYNAAGVAQGGEFRVNTYTTSRPALPSGGDGRRRRLRHHLGERRPGRRRPSVYAQPYNAAGVAQGGELQVNTFTTGNQRTPAVSIDPQGNFVLTWNSNQDGSLYGIYAQRYAESTDTAGPMIAGVFVNDERVLSYGSYRPHLQNIVVSFSQDVTGADLPGNWLLTHDGADVTSDISSISYAFNADTNRYEAALKPRDILCEREFPVDGKGQHPGFGRQTARRRL